MRGLYNYLADSESSTAKALNNAGFPSTDALIAAICNFTAAYNKNAASFEWRKRVVKGAQLRRLFAVYAI